jgi:peptidyl-prolyl cis-trans isomerase B (cyclophilin B)
VVSAAAAVIAVAVGLSVLLAPSDAKNAAASTALKNTATPAAGAATAAATPDPANPCPAPTVKPPANPQSWSSAPASSLAANASWNWTLNTSCGKVEIQLDGKAAPKAVSSTVFLTQKGFYSGVTCHRLTVTGIYVLQCGDPTGSGSGGPGYSYGPLENVPANYVYPAGTVAMARSSDPNSNGSQFFIIYKDPTIGSAAAGGYSVIGKVTSGLSVIEQVAAGGTADTTGQGGLPKRPIAIVTAAVAKKP